jgi:hypothetical protein
VGPRLPLRTRGTTIAVTAAPGHRFG